MWKAAVAASAVGIMLAAVAVPAIADHRGGPGGHPGGGHPGGGGGGPRGGGAPHLGGGHPGGGAPHFAARPHFGGGHPGGGARVHFAAPHSAARASHIAISHGRVHTGSMRAFARHESGAAAYRGRHGSLSRATAVSHGERFGRAAPAGRFAEPARRGEARRGNPAAAGAFAHAHLRTTAAFHPFERRGFRHGHIGWAGPLFWPYAYGDFFYYSLWPDAYDDPFWAYGYDDIYDAMLAPEGYEEYALPPGMGTRYASRHPAYSETVRAAVTKKLANLCADESAEVTGWPIDQIQQVVEPNDQQRAALDDLANATIKASEAIKAGCPTTAAFTPTGRLDDMEKRIDVLIQAVGIVRPPLEKFYDSLNDDQKARFNAMGTAQDETTAANAQSAAPACGSAIPAWPSAAIERAVRPNETQHGKLNDLQAAAAKAADTVKASCPAQTPATPPGRLAAEEKRLQAMRQAVETVRPAMENFYSALNDEQKARFNAIGPRLPKRQG